MSCSRLFMIVSHPSILWLRQQKAARLQTANYGRNPRRSRLHLIGDRVDIRRRGRQPGGMHLPIEGQISKLLPQDRFHLLDGVARGEATSARQSTEPPERIDAARLQ